MDRALRRKAAKWTLCAARWAAVAAGSAGCDNSCYTYFTCPDPMGTTGASGTGGTGGSGGSGGGYACPEDPADGEVREECGVWVSATHGGDTNAGTQAAPLK